MNIEEPPVKAVPEAVRNRPMPQSTPVTAVSERARSRAPPPPGGTPPQRTATWPSPQTGPPADGGGRREPPWNASGRTLIINMESYLQKSEELQVGISELKYLQLGLGRRRDQNRFPSPRTRDEGGYCKFVLFDARRGCATCTDITE